MVNSARPAFHTAPQEFMQLDPSGRQKLFSVLPGVAAGDALFQANCFLEVADRLLRGLATKHDSIEAYGAIHMVEMAMAVVNSVSQGCVSGSSNGLSVEVVWHRTEEELPPCKRCSVLFLDQDGDVDVGWYEDGVIYGARGELLEEVPPFWAYPPTSPLTNSSVSDLTSKGGDHA